MTSLVARPSGIDTLVAVLRGVRNRGPCENPSSPARRSTRFGSFRFDEKDNEQTFAHQSKAG